MNDTAYLVAHFDISTGSPRFVRTAIYSESAESLTHDRSEWLADVLASDEADSYPEAVADLIATARRYSRRYTWALAALDGDSRHWLDAARGSDV